MIVIWADSRWRDAFGLALLSHELDKIGVENMVIDFQLFPQVMETIGNHISGTVLNHTIGKRNRTIIRRVRRDGGKIFVLPTEGKTTPENHQWFYDNQVGYDRLFSWTEQFTPPKTAVTGSPRFQIYTQYRDLIESRNTVLDKYHIPKGHHNTVLVSSSPQAKFTYKNAKRNTQDWADLGRSGAEENAKHSMVKLADFASLATLVGEDENIIIRPHPMEDLLWWERFQGKLFADRGIKSYLISQDYIFNLLAIADTWVVNEHCTTILDKRLYSDEIGLVVFNEISDEGESWADDVVSGVDSAREIANIIKSETTPKSIPLDRYLQLTHYMKVHNRFVFPSPTEDHVGKSVPMSVIGGWKSKLSKRESK